MQNTIDIPAVGYVRLPHILNIFPRQQERVVGRLPKRRLPQACEARAAHFRVARGRYTRPYGAHQHGEHRL